MRVLVCGSRTFNDVGVVFDVLNGVANQYATVVADQYETVVIHGAARGADSLAARWGRAAGWKVLAFRADWEAHGKRASYLRNVQMLEEGKPDLCVAFIDKPLEESKGTAMMVGLARGAGIKTIVVWAT